MTPPTIPVRNMTTNTDSKNCGAFAGEFGVLIREECSRGTKISNQTGFPWKEAASTWSTSPAGPGPSHAALPSLPNGGARIGSLALNPDGSRSASVNKADQLGS